MRKSARVVCLEKVADFVPLAAWASCGSGSLLGEFCARRSAPRKAAKRRETNLEMKTERVSVSLASAARRPLRGPTE